MVPRKNQTAPSGHLLLGVVHVPQTHDTRWQTRNRALAAVRPLFSRPLRVAVFWRAPIGRTVVRAILLR